MDWPREKHHYENPESWRDLPFDVWTAASVGDLEHLCQIIDTLVIKHRNFSKLKRVVEVSGDEKIFNFDTKNAGGWTCLMYAAYYDHAGIARWLLEDYTSEKYIGTNLGLPVNPSIKNGVQRTALMLAASCGHNETIETILDSNKNKFFVREITVLKQPFLYLNSALEKINGI